MKIKIHKQLRSEPKALGLKFIYFVLMLFVGGGCCMLVIAMTTALTIFISIATVCLAYYLFFNLSRSEHQRKVDLSQDISEEIDTIHLL